VSEHHFGLGRGRVPSGRADAIDRIARAHGAAFVAVTLPGDGPRYWFACRNYGEPFDSATARTVIDAVEAAGLWPPVGGLA